MTTSTYIPTSEFSSGYANTAGPDDAWTAGQFILMAIVSICIGMIMNTIVNNRKKKWGSDDDYYTEETKDPITGKYTKTKKKF